ncbi:MAG: DNA repair protein RecN, partial [Acidimicrobiia bacterium]|nr:DNA repair protein RecN [Acidimicrobiia bacterium]
MLTELHIEDLGIIDRLDLVFGEGLVVLTGETGAGKTMLIEAISLLVGGRADAARVRAGATEARIEGRFVVGDVEHIMTRVVPLDGRSRAYVDGRLATVGQLADLGATLVDLHGQHTHQSLLSMAVQRASLDQFAGTDLEPLRLARGRITEIDASLAALGGDAKSRA